MKRYPFYHVDAFTNTALNGNPCAILFDADDLDDVIMQKIAAEMNLPETVFVKSSQKADLCFRFFTPVEELPLAGHPTIATIHALVESGRIRLTQEVQVISLELVAGCITVEIVSDRGMVKDIRMNQLPPQFLRTYSPAEVLPLFSLDARDLLPQAIIQTVSTGTPQLMIPVRSLEVLLRATFCIEPYLEFRSSSDFSSPHLFCLEGFTAEGDTYARHFFPPPDVVEDPFTGSGTGNMAAYMYRHGLRKEASFIAQQGFHLGRPGQARVSVFGAPDAITGVQIAGTAVTCIVGEFLI